MSRKRNITSNKAKSRKISKLEKLNQIKKKDNNCFELLFLDEEEITSKYDEFLF